MTPRSVIPLVALLVSPLDGVFVKTLRRVTDEK
jgi:hypothetical protein